MKAKHILGSCYFSLFFLVSGEVGALQLICGPQKVNPEDGSWTLKGRTYTWTHEVSKGKFMRHFRRWKIDKETLKYEVFSFAEVLDGKSEPGLLDTYRGTCRSDDTHAKEETERQRLAMLQQQDFEAYKNREEVPDATAPGKVFRDCSNCPEMLVVPAGKFTMGSPESEPQSNKDEAQVSVEIARPFAVGRYAVTRGEFAAFVQHSGYKTDGGCHKWVVVEWAWFSEMSWRSPDIKQDDRHPVVCVNWDDAKAYVAW